MCSDNSDTGSVSWDLPPDLQKKFEDIQAHTRRLQRELGVTPMTLEERVAAYAERKKQEEQLKAIIAKHRPPPKWRV